MKIRRLIALGMQFLAGLLIVLFSALAWFLAVAGPFRDRSGEVIGLAWPWHGLVYLLAAALTVSGLVYLWQMFRTRTAATPAQSV